MAYDVPQLLAMTQTELDDLFRASPPGDIPDGSAKGTAIIAPGTRYSQHIADIINIFGWQGKVFDAKKGVLKNKVLPFVSKRYWPRSIKTRAGWTTRSASCSTTPKPRSWPTTSATKSA